jgi:tRNA modification GTPase
MIQQTIAAIGTPIGPGGIGIIRISGPDAGCILKKIFIRKKHGLKRNQDFSDLNDLRPNLLYYGFIRHPILENLIDEVLAVYMKAPKSFTREDVVEIHSHSGFVVLDKILSLVLDSGAVLAEPGEFSKRAFLNGRIDLTQAEAIIDLINAPCEKAAAMASCQVTGGMKRVVENISDKILNFQAKCEAFIEFSDEIDSGQRALTTEIQQTFEKSILPEIKSLINKQKETAVFKDGLHLSIGGVPNVGKSSLLNRLVDKEIAIVSDLPGTTRDIVREYISINGVPVILYDTAGIHDTEDPVECIGIEKAKNQIHKSDVLLWVLDGSREIRDDEKTMIEETQLEKTIIVINKIDVSNETILATIEKKFKTNTCVRLSAKEGINVNKLKNIIFETLMLNSSAGEIGQVSPNLRQRKIFEQIIKEVKPLLKLDSTEVQLELLAEKLITIKNFLEKISGQQDQKDIYDQIFSQFCIGK